jgi:hypothetical protein
MRARKAIARILQWLAYPFLAVGTLLIQASLAVYDDGETIGDRHDG